MSLQDDLRRAGQAMNWSHSLDAYSERHGVQAAPYLTITDDEGAYVVAEHLRDRIEGKTVVEIGGGIGLLSLHMGHIANRVFCIESNPMWTHAFVDVLMHSKPKNVSFLFGAADEFAGHIKADVAVFLTHSGVAAMRETAAKFAPTVIDFHGEMIAAHPEAFDPLAIKLRDFA